MILDGFTSAVLLHRLHCIMVLALQVVYDIWKGPDVVTNADLILRTLEISFISCPWVLFMT